MNNFNYFIVIIHHSSINKQSFVRNCNRKDWHVTICNSISNDHNLETKCSWLIYYFGRKFEDKFLSVAIKLGYPILSQKIDLISNQIYQGKLNGLFFVFYQFFL